MVKHRQHHHFQQQSFTMQELRQLQEENLELELKVKEMSSYHTEVQQLRKDIQKLQVRISIICGN